MAAVSATDLTDLTENDGDLSLLVVIDVGLNAIPGSRRDRPDQPRNGRSRDGDYGYVRWKLPTFIVHVLVMGSNGTTTQPELSQLIHTVFAVR